MSKKKANRPAKRSTRSQRARKAPLISRQPVPPARNVRQTARPPAAIKPIIEPEQPVQSPASTSNPASPEQPTPAKRKLTLRPPIILPKKLLKPLHKPRFPVIFVAFAVTILTASTLLWSILGSLINQGNADQLVNSFLFENAHTFEQAIFPAQHSFLLKWPLFWIISLFHFSNGAFISVTVLTVLATVAALTWCIYKLERRPLYFGTICLALASVLLLVPAQPYAGGLLPVNMAMTTTRNLEYVLYLATLVGVSRWFKLRSWQFWAVVGGLAVVVASDKLFASLAIGSAVIGGFVYALLYWLSRHRKAGKRQPLQQAVAWLAAAAASALLAMLLLSLLNKLHITHILNSPGAAPYSISLSIHNLVLGSFYAIAGLFTNLGANPAFDATTLRGIPHAAFKHLYSPAGLAYLVNATIAIAGLVAAAHIILKALRTAKLKSHKLAARPDRSTFVAIVMICSSIAATLAFIVTDHAYVVDSRYVAIWFFSLFVCIATYSRNRSWPRTHIATVAGILVVTVIGATWGAFQNYYTEKNALSNITARNDNVAQVLQQRHADLLVGDYWRVLPIKAVTKTPITALPLGDCTTPRNVLTSNAWMPDLHHRGFAYLLSLDKGLTDYPQCSLEQIISAYGQPNSSVVVEGKITKPKEIVLFYDRGIGRVPRHQDDIAKAVTGILPVTLNKLPERQTKCDGQPTIMNIVAHEDDDLLFMNPDLQHDIAAGHCVRTVYLTAGDSGSDQFYWVGREHGSEAAYDTMDGPAPDAWIQRTVDIGGEGQSRFVTIASPRQNYNISLIFMHLPDGGLQGQGFSRSHYTSLERLENGTIGSIQSVDGQSWYDSDGLVQSLDDLVRTFQPSEIRTQADDSSVDFPDHSDHRAVGRLVTRAKQLYSKNADISLSYYMGYPVRDYEENVTDTDLEQKQAAFFAYAKFDHGVCQSIEDCSTVPTYYSYLHRQYTYHP